LGGCFLVSDDAFQVLFAETKSSLTHLSLSDAQLTFKALQPLLEEKKLVELKLKRCPNVDDQVFIELQQFKELKCLKIIDSCKNVSSLVYCNLFEKIGPILNTLSLSGYIIYICD
jgi:hypothetical protein